jgi:hypothetical protein
VEGSAEEVAGTLQTLKKWEEKKVHQPNTMAWGMGGVEGGGRKKEEEGRRKGKGEVGGRRRKSRRRKEEEKRKHTQL